MRTEPHHTTPVRTGPGTRLSRRRQAAALLAIAAFLGGCVQARSSDLSGFGRTAAGLGKQTELSFAQANAVGRSAAIDRLVQSGAVGLNEQQFPPVVPPDVARAWLGAMSGLERYGLLLGSLTDDKRGGEATTAIGALGQQLNGVGAGVSPGVAAGFAALGGVLVEATAQRKAREVLRTTDPHIRRLLTAMAEAVGSDDEAGLRGTVFSNWTASLTTVQVAYANAATQHDERAQLAAIARYLDGVDQRDAQLRSLAAFRSSLLSLADAHSAAAAGARRPVAELLTIVDERLDETRRIYEAVAKERAK